MFVVEACGTKYLQAHWQISNILQHTANAWSDKSTHIITGHFQTSEYPPTLQDSSKAERMKIHSALGTPAD